MPGLEFDLHHCGGERQIIPSPTWEFAKEQTGTRGLTAPCADKDTSHSTLDLIKLLSMFNKKIQVKSKTTNSNVPSDNKWKLVHFWPLSEHLPINKFL